MISLFGFAFCSENMPNIKMALLGTSPISSYYGSGREIENIHSKIITFMESLFHETTRVTLEHPSTKLQTSTPHFIHAPCCGIGLKGGSIGLRYPNTFIVVTGQSIACDGLFCKIPFTLAKYSNVLDSSKLDSALQAELPLIVYAMAHGCKAIQRTLDNSRFSIYDWMEMF